MEETISLKQIFEILRKHLTTILVSMFVGLGLSAVMTFFVITPKYSSQAELIVTLPKTENTNVNDVNTNLQMINTYKDMIVSELVMNQVKDRLGSEYGIQMSAKDIKDSISVGQSQNSQMFSINAVDNYAVNAEHIANLTAQVFQENAKDVMDVDKISIISSAVASTIPVSPNNKINLAIGILLGAMVGVGFAFLFELLDRTVKDDKFVTDTLGFTVLGTVPQMTAKELNATFQKQSKETGNKKIVNDQSAETRRSRSRV